MIHTLNLYASKKNFIPYSDHLTEREKLILRNATSASASSASSSSTTTTATLSPKNQLISPLLGLTVSEFYYYTSVNDIFSYMDYGYESNVLDGNIATIIVNEALFLSQLFVRAMVYGNSDINIRQVSDNDTQQRDMLYGNLCEIVTDELSGDLLYNNVLSTEKLAHYNSICLTFINGINTRGLMEVYILGIMEARQLALSRYAGELSQGHQFGVTAAASYIHTVYPTPPPPKTDPKYIAMYERLEYISEIFNSNAAVGSVVSTNNYLQLSQKSMDKYNTIRQTLLICFVVCLFALHVIVLYPIFSEMSDRTKHTLSLLLVLPPDVVTKVPQIQKFVKDAAKRVT